MDKQAAIIMTQTKSTGIAVLLTLLFGGFGLFYATVSGGIIMSIVQGIVIVIALCTLGVGGILLPIVHLVCLAWAISAVNAYNRNLISQMQ